MNWLNWAALIMQFVILFTVAGSAWHAFRASKSNTQTLNAIREYRREIGWLSARLEALEQQGAKNGRVGSKAETSRGK
jgi:hypothetical protein